MTGGRARRRLEGRTAAHRRLAPGRGAGTASRLRLHDLASEALAGLLQRPGRSALTMLGTVLGIAAFVAIVGLSQTASGQVNKAFNVLDATMVTVTDSGATQSASPVMDFPPNADAVVDRINGVVSAGVWWNVPLFRAAVSALPMTSQSAQLSLPVIAATPGALATGGATLQTGVLYNQFHESADQNVVVIGKAAAARLGISGLQNSPAIFIAGQAFTVIGIVSKAPGLPQLTFGIAVPASTAIRIWGPPPRYNPARMIIRTRLGAAQVVAGQVPVALRPDNPRLLSATAPPNPAQLRHNVTTSLSSLFLALAAISLIVGAIGIANTTLVAVLERAGEIGLRRALGARPRHIGTQFLAESTALGLFGGLIGVSLGIFATLGVTVYNHWTAIMDPRIVLAAPVAGAVIGLLAGLYPALRASTLEPADALRH